MTSKETQKVNNPIPERMLNVISLQLVCSMLETATKAKDFEFVPELCENLYKEAKIAKKKVFR